MNPSMHLTEDQMDDVLIGDLAAEAALHLKQCADCRVRVDAAKAPIASFAAVSMAWSERRSATAPVTLVQAANSAGQRHANWIAVATAAMLIAISAPLTMHEKRTQIAASDVAPRSALAKTAKAMPAPLANPSEQARPAAATPHRGNADAEIAHDNEMLQAIHRELDASVQPPSDDFGLMAVGGTLAHGQFAPVQYWD